MWIYILDKGTIISLAITIIIKSTSEPILLILMGTLITINLVLIVGAMVKLK